MAEGGGLVETIRFLLDKSGLVQATSALDEISKSGKRLESQMGSLNGTIQRVGQTIAGAFAVEKITEFVKGSIEEFAHLERALNATSFEMTHVGISAEKELPKAKEKLEEMQKAGRGLMTETVPTFQHFVGITKSTSSALYATSLAADIAAAKNISLSEAAGILTNILEGKANKALKSLGLENRDAAGHAYTNAEALRLVIKTFEGFSEQANDTQKQLSQMSGAWASLKETIGATFAPAIEVAAAALRVLTATWNHTVSQFIIGIGYFKGAWDKEFAEMATRENMRALASDVADAWAGVGKESGEAEANARHKAEKELDEIAARAQREQDDARAAEEAKHAAELARRKALAEIEAEIKLQEVLVAEKKKGTKEWLDARFALFELEQRKELMAENLTEEAKKAILARFAAEKQKATVDSWEAWFQGFDAAMKKSQAAAVKYEKQTRDTQRALLEAQLQDVRQYGLEETAIKKQLLRLDERQAIQEAQGNEQALLNIHRRFAVLRHNLDVQQERTAVALAKEERDQKIQLMSQTFALASQVFEGNKALQIATTIINTYTAAVQALASPPGPPWTIPLAAMTIAWGLKQVQQIRSQNKGFDDPANDALVFAGSKKWAQDQTRLMLAGFNAGWREFDGRQTAAPVTTHNTTHHQPTVVNINSKILRTDRDLVELSRDLARASRRDTNQRFVR